MGIWVEVFFIPCVNDPPPPASSLFHFFCPDHLGTLQAKRETANVNHTHCMCKISICYSEASVWSLQLLSSNVPSELKRVVYILICTSCSKKKRLGRKGGLQPPIDPSLSTCVAKALDLKLFHHISLLRASPAGLQSH